MKRERIPVVKVESELDTKPYESCVVQCKSGNDAANDNKTSLATFNLEKEKLIQELADSKEENQNLFFEVQRQQKKITSLEEKVSNLNTQLSQISVERNEEKEQLQTNLANQEKRIEELIRERNSMQAKYKQLMSCTKSNHHSQKSNESNKEEEKDEYEVETILKHENRKGNRRFLIRWKNYSPSYDTWEKESNLNCPEILTKYLQSKGLSALKKK